MAIRTALWKVGQDPTPLQRSSLPKEQLLEDMIVRAPALLSQEWMLIGRQEDTGFGGRIDLLAIAPDASLVLIELKRDRTPREVVAQAIDYASWVEGLKAEDVREIYERFAPGRLLAEDFQSRFGGILDEEALNQNHQIVIVAGSLDASSERIIGYLSGRGISINVLCFEVFALNGELLLSRAWLLDPIESQINAAQPERSREPWNGEYYCSFGHDVERNWEDARELGFVSAGGGSWYTKTLQLLSPGSRIWVKVPGIGFVGVGQVAGSAQPISEFRIKGIPIRQLAKRSRFGEGVDDDPELCEYFVPVEWVQTTSLDDAVKEIGLFGNQNTVCKPTTPKWRSTVERLKQHFARANPDPSTPVNGDVHSADALDGTRVKGTQKVAAQLGH
ncbi:MAG TPA: endonuclease NucS domain-containing protein [Polyangiaceae bacterium]|nr:endonuclease NucS domain-containing protein [Polyangiaceae bacterium]